MAPLPLSAMLATMQSILHEGPRRLRRRSLLCEGPRKVPTELALRGAERWAFILSTAQNHIKHWEKTV